MASGSFDADPVQGPTPTECRSNLQRALEEGRFVVTADVLPPKGGDLAAIVQRVACLRGKVVAVNVADMPSAFLTQSPLATCVKLLGQGIEPILQLTCRDRNLLALQADLLAAHALGIRNVLGLTGDHVRFGDHPMAKPVFDISATELMMVIGRLNAGFSAAGTSLEGACCFFPGAAANPTQEPLAPQLLRIQCKAQAGARFFQTQPLFLVEQWIAFQDQLLDLGVETPVLAGIFLLENAGTARYMQHKVPGVTIPASVMKGIEETANPRAYGHDLVREFILGVQEAGAAGVHLMTHNRFEAVAALVDELNFATTRAPLCRVPEKEAGFFGSCGKQVSAGEEEKESVGT